MKIINKTNCQKIDDAIKLFELNINNILEKIEQLPKEKYFTYTEDDNKQVVRKLRAFFKQEKIVEIEGYKSWNRWSKVIGYTSKGRYFINLRKIDSLTSMQWSGNICHELCHIASYKHGNNYPSEKKKVSVPYLIGYLISSEMMFSDFIKLSMKYKNINFENKTTTIN